MNIRSIRNKFSSLQAHISSLNKKVAIIILSEVWIKSDEVGYYDLDGYKLHCKCNDNYAAGGIMVYVCNNIHVICTSTTMLSADLVVLELKLQCGVKFTLIALYRLQEFSVKMFLDEIDYILRAIVGNLLVVGDMNIDILKNNYLSNNYLDLMYNYGISCLLKQPTRITNTSESCIDHVFARFKYLNHFNLEVCNIGISDHCLIAINLQNNYNCSENFQLPHKQTLYNVEKAKQYLQMTNWSELLNCQDVDIWVEKLYTEINKAIEYGTESNITSRKIVKAKFKSPWINNNILNKLKLRNKLYKIKIKRPYDDKFRCYFENFCSQLSNLIDSTKNKYYSDLLTSCNGNSREQWKIINSISGNKKKLAIHRLEVDGEVIDNKQQICDTINDYLINVHEQLIVDNPGGAAGGGAASPATAGSPLGSGDSQPANSFFLRPVDQNEIKCIIQNLKNKRSCGYDKVTVSLVKCCSDIFAVLLEKIINLSFAKGRFPKLLKKSVVIPIPKKSGEIKLDNLRPISLLSVFSKIFEKAMKSRLLSYLNGIEFFSKNQFGFMKGKSTEDALSYFLELLYSKINENNNCTAVFIDFRKAFDLVDRDCLLKKLYKIGIRGNAFDWFREFLTDREQIVKIDEHFSKTLRIKKGVPQGSVLSATLFLIFINDLLELPCEGRMTAFADDVAFLFWNKNNKDQSNNINNTMTLLREWCFHNKMSVNVSKTKIMNFMLKPSLIPQIKFKYHARDCNRPTNCKCEEIENVTHFKYLGVVIDKDLSWKIHIDNLLHQVRCGIRQFYFLRNICNIDLLRSLYFALIHSKLQYGIHCWGGTFQNLTQKIRIVQNHFIRIILFKNKMESSFPLYTSLKVLPIQHLFVFKVLQIFFIRSGNNGTELIQHKYTTRSKAANLIKKPKINKTIMARSFVFLGPKIFNDLPNEMKNAKSILVFKKQLKQWLFSFETTTHLTQILK